MLGDIAEVLDQITESYIDLADMDVISILDLNSLLLDFESECVNKYQLDSFADMFIFGRPTYQEYKADLLAYIETYYTKGVLIN